MISLISGKPASAMAARLTSSTAPSDRANLRAARAQPKKVRSLALACGRHRQRVRRQQRQRILIRAPSVLVARVWPPGRARGRLVAGSAAPRRPTNAPHRRRFERQPSEASEIPRLRAIERQISMSG